MGPTSQKKNRHLCNGFFCAWLEEKGTNHIKECFKTYIKVSLKMKKGWRMWMFGKKCFQSCLRISVYWKHGGFFCAWLEEKGINNIKECFKRYIFENTKRKKKSMWMWRKKYLRICVVKNKNKKGLKAWKVKTKKRIKGYKKE